MNDIVSVTFQNYSNSTSLPLSQQQQQQQQHPNLPITMPFHNPEGQQQVIHPSSAYSMVPQTRPPPLPPISSSPSLSSHPPPSTTILPKPLELASEEEKEGEKKEKENKKMNGFIETVKTKVKAVSDMNETVQNERKIRQKIERTRDECLKELKDLSIPYFWRKDFEDRLKSISNQLSFSNSIGSDTKKLDVLDYHVNHMYTFIRECKETGQYPITCYNPFDYK